MKKIKEERVGVKLRYCQQAPRCGFAYGVGRSCMNIGLRFIRI